MHSWKIVLIFCLCLFILGCDSEEPEEAQATLVPSTVIPATQAPIPTQTPEPTRSSDVYRIATDAPSRFGRFADFDAQGMLTGFDMTQLGFLSAQLSKPAQLELTLFDGMLDAVARGEFDAAIAALPIADVVPQGVVFSEPYHTINQQLVVLANEQEIVGVGNIPAGIQVGAVRYEEGESAVKSQLSLDPVLFDTAPDLLQALIDRQIRAAVLDSDNAQTFTALYDKQLKIVGDPLSTIRYGIAVHADNQQLLTELNSAIAATRTETQVSVNQWLVSDGAIEAGESLVGTLTEELVIGLVTETPIAELYAGRGNFNPVAWELAANIGSSLYAVDAANNILPVLAIAPPDISEDGLEYTISLRTDVVFPNGNAFTPDDVRRSVFWASGQGNYLVNNYLKDDDANGLADDDSVEVIDGGTIKFRLGTPIGFFPQLLATPAYTIIDEACDPVFNFNFQQCDGFGVYDIFDVQQSREGTVTLLKLRASPSWQGAPPEFSQVEVRIYQSASAMQEAMTLGALDVAWTGMTNEMVSTLSSNSDFFAVDTPAEFESYLVFVHTTPPWDDPLVRQAASWAINREQMAGLYEGSRKPLNSPILDHVAGHVPILPERNVDKAIELLEQAGFSRDNALPISIWVDNAGRYSDKDLEMVDILKANLDETGIFQVTVESADWNTFLLQKSLCNYPAFLLGWPPSIGARRYTDPMVWLDFFIDAPDEVCSNYESEAMTELINDARAESDLAERTELYQEIQTLWAEELPTLPLLQEFDRAVARNGVTGLQDSFDGLGLMQYGRLGK